MKIFRSVFTRRTALLAFSAAIIGGCTDFSDPPSQLGHLTVSLKDETGAGVAGIPVDLLLNDRSTLWATLRTSADGTGEFRAGDGGVIPQGYIVRVVLTGTSYRLAANETNDKPIQVVIGQTHTANFVITKSSVGQNPGG
jgi:hypothetical protein